MWFCSFCFVFFFFFSSRRRHTRSLCDWSSDVCSSDLLLAYTDLAEVVQQGGVADFLELLARELHAAKRPVPRPVHGFRQARSEERRVGKECKSRWARWREEKKRKACRQMCQYRRPNR